MIARLGRVSTCVMHSGLRTNVDRLLHGFWSHLHSRVMRGTEHIDDLGTMKEALMPQHGICMDIRPIEARDVYSHLGEVGDTIGNASNQGDIRHTYMTKSGRRDPPGHASRGVHAHL
jgi:hypothetical protein